MCAHPQRNRAYLTKEEQRRIEAAISAKDDPVNLGIWLGLYTGLRIGELCALKWKDVLFDSRCIRISKTLQRILCPDAKGRQKDKDRHRYAEEQELEPRRTAF